MKSGAVSAFIKHFFIMIFSLTSVLMACGQHKSGKGKIQPAGKVNMKELQEKEKKAPPDSLKRKYDTGPVQNTKSTPLPVPDTAIIKKTTITPGQLKKDSAQKKKDTTGKDQ